MAGGIAHEINNPLAIIKGKATVVSQLIQGLPMEITLRDKLKKNLSSIESTVDRIAKIVKGMKTFSREADRDPFVEASLADIFTDSLGLISEKLRHKNVKLTFEGEYEGIYLFCNPTQMGQVLLNIISNSMDAIEGQVEKWIKIQITYSKPSFMIRIIDSGFGIADPVVEKMMNPFFTTKEVGRGTGLGLSICKGILVQHGGDLEYELHHGHTSIKILFPVSVMRKAKVAA